MKHKIDPSVDCVFKTILGSEKNKNLLIHFLNAILETEGEKRISEVTILAPYNEREFENDKLSIVDVKAKDQMDNHYQIEIQIAIHPGLASRILYTWSSIYHSLMGKGESYTSLMPVISIWLLNESLFPEINDCHIPFGAWNMKHKTALSDHFAIHLLQLQKWQMKHSGHTEKDRWIYLFKEGGNVDIDNPPEILTTKEMRHVMGIMKDFSENQKNYLRYQSHLEALSERATWRVAVEQAQKEKEQAQKEKEQAQKEKEQERKETAKKLLAMGVLTVEQIAQVTGLSEKEILELQSEFTCKRESEFALPDS